MKNSIVDECLSKPYSTSVCLDKSSAELIGVTILSTKKIFKIYKIIAFTLKLLLENPARLIVHNNNKINVKNNQQTPTILPAIDLSKKIIITTTKY